MTTTRERIMEIRDELEQLGMDLDAKDDADILRRVWYAYEELGRAL